MNSKEKNIEEQIKEIKGTISGILISNRHAMSIQQFESEWSSMENVSEMENFMNWLGYGPTRWEGNSEINITLAYKTIHVQILTE